MATTKKKRSFDAAFKLRVVEYAEQDTNRGAGRKFGVDEKNCNRSRIVAVWVWLISKPKRLSPNLSLLGELISALFNWGVNPNRW